MCVCVCVRACVRACVHARARVRVCVCDCAHALIQNHSSSVSPNPLQTFHPDITAMADWALNKHSVCKHYEVTRVEER